MLIGTPQTSPQQSSGAQDTADIFNASIENFEEKVIHASMQRPVLVDFWAPWCGPCKQLMPALEKAVSEAGGSIALAKVNLDENEQLAAALRVQSVPTVFAFYGGRPIDAFQGVQSESQIKAFIDNVLKASGAEPSGGLDIEDALEAAANALADGALREAQELYAAVLQKDQTNILAFTGMLRTFIAAEAVDHAKQMLDNAPEEIVKHPKFSEAQAVVELALKAPADDELSALKAKLAENPEDHSVALELAEASFAAGQKEAAIEILLESIKRDREWNDEAARKMLLEFFKALGMVDPLTIQARKKLSSLLFS